MGLSHWFDRGRIAEAPLGTPPEVVNVGVGVHGTRSLRDVYHLPDLWQFHLYQYNATLIVAGVEHPIRPGRVSLIPPGTRIEYHYRARSEHLYAHLRLKPGPAVPIPVIQDAAPQTPLLTTLLRHSLTTTPPQATANIWSALWQTATLWTPEEPGKPTPAVARALTYIETHLADPMTVPEIARAADISHNHLTRLFKQETGRTVVAHIRHRRLQRAHHLLSESTLSIPAIAASVGIPDLQAFNKACHRELGTAPRTLRAFR